MTEEREQYSVESFGPGGCEMPVVPPFDTNLPDDRAPSPVGIPWHQVLIAQRDAELATLREQLAAAERERDDLVLKLEFALESDRARTRDLATAQARSAALADALEAARQFTGGLPEKVYNQLRAAPDVAEAVAALRAGRWLLEPGNLEAHIETASITSSEELQQAADFIRAAAKEG